MREAPVESRTEQFDAVRVLMLRHWAARRCEKLLDLAEHPPAEIDLRDRALVPGRDLVDLYA